MYILNPSGKRKPNPYEKTNFLSQWLYCWTHEIFGKGMRPSGVEAEDVYEHPMHLDSALLSDKLEKHWTKEQKACDAKKNKTKPNLTATIFRTFGWSFIPISILYSALEIAIHVAQPLFLGNFVMYFSNEPTDVSLHEAYLNAGGIALCALLMSLCFHPFMWHTSQVGMRARLGCAGLIYRKSLRSALTADNSGISAFALAVLSTDLPQFDASFCFFYDLWKGPVETVLFALVMYREVGWPALVGVAAIAIFIPLQGWAAKAAVKFKERSCTHTDERVQLMNELIAAIQVVKMYAWERSFARLVTAVRKSEMRAIRGSMNIYASLQCTSMISKLALFLSLLSYAYTGEIVTARKVYIVSSYFDLLNSSLLNFWPLAINTWAETFVCMRRVQTFLLQTEIPKDAQEHTDENGNNTDGTHHNNIHTNGVKATEVDVKAASTGRWHHIESQNTGISLRHLSASWDNVDMMEKRTIHLHDISCEIAAKHFVGIAGSVGAGKSTLLHAILGEMGIVSGSVMLRGRVSYAPQDPWIYEASVRENIIFSEPYDEQRYRQVLRVCELDRDLTLMPHGDTTIVGERGSSLSGGQKARIALARTVYRKADVYLLDDPLAAVDTQVGARLVQQCLCQFLDGSTRVLVTHHITHLRHANNIILMESGSLSQQGTYEQLKSTAHFRAYAAHEAADEHLRMSQLHHSDSIVETIGNIDRTVYTDSEKSHAPATTHDNGADRVEQQLQGSVRLRMYLHYFGILKSPFVVVCVLLLFVLARACLALMDIFVARWSSWEESAPADHETSQEFAEHRIMALITYTCLISTTLLLYIARTFGFFSMCIRISVKLHDLLYNGVIRATMRFFHTNSSGRILNRFASDISKIDVSLPEAMFDTIQFHVDAIAVLVVTAISNIWLLVPAIMVVCVFYIFRGLYIGASRSIKRLEAISRSPLYTHSNETFQGLTTIRAQHACTAMEGKFHARENDNSATLFLYVATNRAFALWTDLVCVVYIVIVTFSFLVFDRNFQSGDVGLAITQSMSLVIMCQWGMRQTAEMENNMVSVERVIEYAHTPSEPPLKTDTAVRLAREWPATGRMEFKNVHLRYSENGNYVLKDLNLQVRSMEKLGVVGRTGAGKSSIVQAIFRLAITEGAICIDGLDIETLGLHDLRSRISIIPQEPVLFTGTLRYNLDPFEERTDAELWQTLDDVKMRETVQRLDGGLLCALHDGGSNFSIGQKQLICMARAILRRNKILIMDEPTANVDPETDKLLQNTVQRNFKGCTVLTIAHRLHTIMDNDRVLVMDAGKVVEFGHPHELLQNKDGHLYRLVQLTGPPTAKQLKHIAALSYQKRVACQHLHD